MLGDRVVLVRMALGAAPCEPHPCLPGRRDAVLHRRVPELFVVGASFRVGHRVAMEAGRYQIVLGRLREQVAGQLECGEAVEREVLVQGSDHPVPIGPDRAQAVFLVAHRICVAGQVQPDPGPALAIGGRAEQAVDQSVVRTGRVVLRECFRLRGCWRQAGEIEGDASREGVAVGLGRGGEARRIEAGEDELVDGAGYPARIRDLGRVRTDGTLEGPVGREAGARVDPLPQRIDLLRGQALTRRRHRIPIGLDPCDQAARGAVAGNQAGIPAVLPRGPLAGIQPEIRHPGVVVRSVTRQAPLQDRSNVSVEVGCRGQDCRCQQRESYEDGDPSRASGLAVHTVVPCRDSQPEPQIASIFVANCGKIPGRELAPRGAEMSQHAGVKYKCNVQLGHVTGQGATASNSACADQAKPLEARSRLLPGLSFDRALPPVGVDPNAEFLA